MSTLAPSPAYAALLTEVMPRIIRTEEENEIYTEILYNLTMKGESATAEEEDVADLLTMLIEDFEEKHYSLPRSPPGSMVEFLMDQNNLGAQDMLNIFPSVEIVAEVLNGTRELETQQIRKLSERFHVSPELFF